MKTLKILKKANLQDTYWGKKIIAAEKRGYFTQSNKNQSEEWVTCACGRLTHDIPRTARFRAPMDIILADLGLSLIHI